MATTATAPLTANEASAIQEAVPVDDLPTPIRSGAYAAIPVAKKDALHEKVIKTTLNRFGAMLDGMAMDDALELADAIGAGVHAAIVEAVSDRFQG